MSQGQRMRFRVRDIIPVSSIAGNALLPTEQGKIIVGIAAIDGAKRNVSYWPDEFAPHEHRFREAIDSQQVYWLETPNELDIHHAGLAPSEAQLILNAIVNNQTDVPTHP